MYVIIYEHYSVYDTQQLILAISRVVFGWQYHLGMQSVTTALRTMRCRVLVLPLL